MKRKTKIAAISLISAIALAGCQQTDVLGNKAQESFGKIIESHQEIITQPQDAMGSEFTSYMLTAPDGSSGFFWGKNTGISVDAQPFIDAGLDISKLDPQNLVEGKLIVSVENRGYEEKSDDPSQEFSSFVSSARDSVGYHAPMDHFGIKLGNGNMFEWAQDTASNDKDIVFVLDPEFIGQYGADVANIEGWLYADVEVMDEDGKLVTVKKLLKPFDLE